MSDYESNGDYDESSDNFAEFAKIASGQLPEECAYEPILDWHTEGLGYIYPHLDPASALGILAIEAAVEEEALLEEKAARGENYALRDITYDEATLDMFETELEIAKSKHHIFAEMYENVEADLSHNPRQPTPMERLRAVIHNAARQQERYINEQWQVADGLKRIFREYIASLKQCYLVESDSHFQALQNRGED